MVSPAGFDGLWKVEIGGTIQGLEGVLIVMSVLLEEQKTLTRLEEATSTLEAEIHPHSEPSG